jgi:recombinational DNA repair protein (RecF pathway)
MGESQHRRLSFVAKRLDPEVARSEMLKQGLQPLIEYPGSGKPWKSMCKKCHRIVSPQFDSIRQGRGGCIECGKEKSALNRRKLKNEDIRVRLKKYNISSRSELLLMDEKYEFECGKCDNEFQFTLRHLIKKFPNPCPYCDKRRVSDSEAIQTFRKSKLEPLVGYPGNNKPWKAKCLKCGKTVSPRYSAIKRGRGGCAYCAKNKVDPNVAQEIMLKIELKPLVPFPGGDKPWLCKCMRCGKEIAPKYTNARVNKLGCLWCARQKIDENQVVKAMRIAKLRPLEPYPGSSTKWKSKCLVCGKIIYPRWAVVKKSGRGCSNCKGKNISTAKRYSQESVMPLMRIRKLEPLEPYPGTGKPWKCKCLQCQREVFPKHENLVQGQGGCKYCAKSGLDYLAPACVYLIFHTEWKANKIGIAGLNTKRLDKHKSKGWETYKVLTVANGEAAFTIEQKVLKWIRRTKNLPPYLNKVDGWSETFSSEAMTLPEVWRKVQEIALEVDKQTP